MMTYGDQEGLIFLSHPHTNNGAFFLLSTKYHILYLINMKNYMFAILKETDYKVIGTDQCT